jgi:hypothetical protein
MGMTYSLAASANGAFWRRAQGGPSSGLLLVFSLTGHLCAIADLVTVTLLVPHTWPIPLCWDVPGSSAVHRHR